MALDTTKNRMAFRTLARLYYDPVHYLRLADRTSEAGDAVWEGRILSVSPLRESFPRGFETGLPLPEITLEVNNRDGRLNEYLEVGADCFAARQVKIYCWEIGTAFDPETDLIFSGHVQFPDGASIKDGVLRLRVSDWWSRIKAKIPATFFNADDHPDADPSILGRPVPILYGDFTEHLTDEGHMVQAFCVDTAGDCVFQVCAPGEDGMGHIGEMLHVERAGTITPAAVKTADTATGTFTVDAGDYVWQAGDRFWIEARGNLDTGGDLIENPAEAIRDLIVRYSSALDSNIDAASYALTHARLVNHKVRKQITDEVDLLEEVENLAFQAGIDLSNRGGEIAMFPWRPHLASDSQAPDLDANDIVEGSWETRIDPDRVYNNRVRADYQWDPFHAAFEHTETVEHAGIVTEDHERHLEFDWYGEGMKRKVLSRAGRLAWLYARPVRVHVFKAGFRALKWRLGDRRTISFEGAQPPVALRDVQIRKLEKNLDTGIVTVTAWDAFLRTRIGRWAPADVPTYEDASTEQRTRWGFWTDSSGLADPSDPDSDASHWV